MKSFFLFAIALVAVGVAMGTEVEYLEGTARDFEGMSVAEPMNMLFAEDDMHNEIQMAEVDRAAACANPPCTCTKRPKITCKLVTSECSPPKRKSNVFTIIKYIDFGCVSFHFKITLSGCLPRRRGRRSAKRIWKCIKKRAKRCRFSKDPKACSIAAVDRCDRGNGFMMITPTPDVM